MKYYWVAIVVLLFVICYVVANRDTIILEHLTSATSGPMTGLTGPAPATPAGSTGATGPTKSAGDDSDVAALTSKLTALQKEVDDMKTQSKAQMSQASAAQASLQTIT
jgi:hypothetical protein